jgi:predicted ribosome quality control (RQC) complex YloA/Tae2 family protein
MEEIEEKYFTAAYEHLFQQYLQREETRLQKSLQQLRKIQEKILQQLEQSDESEHFLQWGELLKGNFALIPPEPAPLKPLIIIIPKCPSFPFPSPPKKP